MVQHNVRYPAAGQLRTWIRAARKLYDNRKGVRTQEAAELMNLADDLTTRAAAAGIPLRSSQERTAQAAKSGEHLPSAQGEGPSVGPRHSPATGEHPTTFAHLAIAVLRSEAQFLRSLWYCGEAQAVAQHLALRMVRQGDPSPSPKVQRVWEHTYRAAYHRHVRGRQDHVRQLEARALALEQELESLLSDTRGHEAAPSREAESTGESPVPLKVQFGPVLSGNPPRLPSLEKGKQKPNTSLRLRPRAPVKAPRAPVKAPRAPAPRACQDRSG
ncbi:KRUF family protein [Toxoplasma gondii]|nr:KRUF family protein [Toxoplasma gondii]